MTTAGAALAEVAAAVDARLIEFDARVAGVTSTAYPFVATYVASPVAPSEDLGDCRRRVVFTINTVTVGETEEQVSALLARVADAFHRWRPDVGAKSWRLEHDAAMPPAYDDDLPDRRVWTARDAWSVSVLI